MHILLCLNLSSFLLFMFEIKIQIKIKYKLISFFNQTYIYFKDGSIISTNKHAFFNL